MARVDLLAGGLLVIVIEHLEFTHPAVSSVALARETDREAVVAAGRQLDLQASHEIGVFPSSVNGAAFLRTALDGSSDDLVIIRWPRPAGEVATVEYGLEALVAMAGENLVGDIERDVGERGEAHVTANPIGRRDIDRALRGDGALIGRDAHHSAASPARLRRTVRIQRHTVGAAY